MRYAVRSTGKVMLWRCLFSSHMLGHYKRCQNWAATGGQSCALRHQKYTKTCPAVRPKYPTSFWRLVSGGEKGPSVLGDRIQHTEAQRSESVRASAWKCRLTLRSREYMIKFHSCFVSLVSAIIIKVLTKGSLLLFRWDGMETDKSNSCDKDTRHKVGWAACISLLGGVVQCTVRSPLNVGISWLSTW